MSYIWRPAVGTDVQNIVDMAQSHFECEIDDVFTPDPIAYSRNITLAVVNQFYNPLSELVSVATDDSNKLLAYTWMIRGQRAAWSDDEMCVVRMCHIDLTLPTKLRVRLVIDQLKIWREFAKLCNVPIICSTTMRHDQHGFLELHRRDGYSVRGSYAYLRLS